MISRYTSIKVNLLALLLLAAAPGFAQSTSKTKASGKPAKGTVAVFDLAKRNWTTVEKITASGISCLTHDAEGSGFLASAYDGRIYPIASRAAPRHNNA